MGLSESVGLTFVARNDSSAEVKSINVEIKQVSFIQCSMFNVRLRSHGGGYRTFVPDLPFGRVQGLLVIVIAYTSRVEMWPDFNIYDLLVPS